MQGRRSLVDRHRRHPGLVPPLELERCRQWGNANQALVRLTFSHFGKLVKECRRRSQAELNKLAPNMRQPMDCPRQRLPIQVEFFLDADPIFQTTVAPSGLWGDGEATVYEQFPVAAGSHRLLIRMRDSSRSEGFDYQLDEQVSIKAMQNLVIGFDSARKQFVIH